MNDTSSSNGAIVSILLLVVSTIALILSVVNRTSSVSNAAGPTTYYISPQGHDSNDGLSVQNPFVTIQKGVDAAMPGDSIMLLDGTYLQDVRTRRNGTEASPITVTGSTAAIVRGSGASSRVIEINHDSIILDGFTVDGRTGNGGAVSDYRGKLIYAIGTEPLSGVNGVKIRNMTIRNARDECVRFRYFAQQNEIAHNTISACGIEDFVFGGSGKNGEAIYLGTAPEQWGLNGAPTNDPDETSHNWVHHNTIDSQGAECIDVKEAATQNVVEYNTCTGVRDAATGGLDSRGNGNIFRYNTSMGNASAGIRFGGDTVAWGVYNDAYGNTITNNAAGGIKFMNAPQGTVCGNTMENNSGGNSVGTYMGQFDPAGPCPVPTEIPVPTLPDPTATLTPLPSPIPTATAAPTQTPSPTPTHTITPTRTPTRTLTPTRTRTPTPPPDTTAPSVSITNPTNGGTVKRNSSITIRATATDNTAVTRVRFYVNGSLKCTDTSASYTCTWSVGKTAHVTYSLQAVANDAAGNTGTHTISVTSAR